MKFNSFLLKMCTGIVLTGCTYTSSYKGVYYSPTDGEQSLVLEAGGTGYTMVNGNKFPLTWEDPISNRDTGLQDNTGYDYCYVTYGNSDKTQSVFFDPEIKKDGLFTTVIGDDGLPTLILIGIKK